MTRALILVGVLCGGCLVVPKTETTVRRVGTEDGAATFSAPQSVTLESHVEGRTVYVQAKRIGRCTQPVFEVLETTKDTHASLGGASDPRAMVFGFLLAPVTIPISALITGLSVAGAKAETTRTSRPLGEKHFACSLEADRLMIAFTLPSGATLQRTTTRDGRVRLDIPDSEPYEGSLAVDAPTAPRQEVAYAMPRPAITVLRDSVISCAAKEHIEGNVTAKVTISDTGKPTRVWLSTGDATFNACVAGGISNVDFPEKTYGTTLAIPLTLTAMR